MFKTDSEQSSSKSLPARISQKANPRAPISASTPFDATPIIEATKRKTPKKNVMKAIKTEVFDNEEEAYESASNTPMEQDAEEQEEEESKPSTSKASLLLPKKRPYLEH